MNRSGSRAPSRSIYLFIVFVSNFHVIMCGRACVVVEGIGGKFGWYFLLFFDFGFFLKFRLWVGRGRKEREERTYVSWADDGTVPVRHEDIVAVLEAIGARSVSDALLALLKFL